MPSAVLAFFISFAWARTLSATFWNAFTAAGPVCGPKRSSSWGLADSSAVARLARTWCPASQTWAEWRMLSTLPPVT